MFDEERAELHRRVGEAQGDRVLFLVLSLDKAQRNEDAGRPGWEHPAPPANAADIAAELQLVLRLSDDELNRLADAGGEMLARLEQAHPRPATN